jgi:hypothetical protein
VQGGVPVGEVKQQQVLEACEKVMPVMGGAIETLWGECGPSSQDLLLRVMEEGSVSCTGIASADIGTLIERGFIYQSGTRLQRACGLLKRFLDDRPHEGNALVRLFGSPEAYQQNFRGVMERRLAHLPGIDPTLKRYLERGVEDLPAHPEVFLSNIRGIIDRAFELIWAAELGDKWRIPSEWMAIWNRNNERNVDQWKTSFPQSAQRLRLLQLMTGTDASVACAKFVTKNTYALMSAAYTFGELGQHREGVTIEPGTGYASLLLCIELAASVSRELACAPVARGSA